MFIEQGIFDELELMIHPVIFGNGHKLFTGHEPAMNLELVSARTIGSGINKLHYKRAGN